MTGTKAQCITYLANIKGDNKMYEVKEHKPKRGNKANNYFHRLVGLLAQGEKAKFYAKKNELIMQYGNRKHMYKGDTLDYRIEPVSYDWMSDPEDHLEPSQYMWEVEGKPTLRLYWKLCGTRTYDSAEMAHLIDCTRDECVGCGIPWEEIETFEEKRIMERLRRQGERKHN